MCEGSAATFLPVYPRLWALGEFGEGQFAQVQVLLRVKNPALQQLLPAATNSHALQQTYTAQRTMTSVLLSVVQSCYTLLRTLTMKS